MQRVNLPIFYQFGATMGELRVLDARDPVNHPTVINIIFKSSIWIMFFLSATNDITLPGTRDAVQNLYNLLGEVKTKLQNLTQSDASEPELLGDIFMRRLNEELHAFELMFERESRRISVFAVRPIGILDTEKLIESAEKRFPDNLLAVMPQLTIRDLRESGKCLAFGLPTACAFHVCRATEALMLAYYEALTNQPWPYNKRDWYTYNNQLASNGAPKAITNRLGEIREDRNAYAHPDITVPMDEAPIVFELCNGVIHLMAKEIERLKTAQAVSP